MGEDARDHAARLLGIDTETMERRLLWGERVEQLEPRHVPTRLGDARQEALVTNSVRDWLTRQDIPELP